jgi:hypothetical protein
MQVPGLVGSSETSARASECSFTANSLQAVPDSISFHNFFTGLYGQVIAEWNVLNLLGL